MDFEESHRFPSADSDQMIFGLDMDDSQPFDGNTRPATHQHIHQLAWPSHPISSAELASPITIAHPAAEYHNLVATAVQPQQAQRHPFYDPAIFAPRPDIQTALADMDDGHSYLSRWLTESALEPPASAPIPIPDPNKAHQTAAPGFATFAGDTSPFLQDASSFSPGSFSPDSEFAALHSPTSPHVLPFGEHPYGSPLESVSPHETSLHIPVPVWASQLWTPSSPLQQPGATPSPPSAFQPQLFFPEHDDYAFGERARFADRRLSASTSLLFQPSSAPSAISATRPPLARGYSTRPRAESVATAVSADDQDADATVRRKARHPQLLHSQFMDESLAGFPSSPSSASTDKVGDNAPQKSLLRPPKLAPSAWQLYFTDWIQRHQATSTKKLNVAQAAKEAGQEYKDLSPEEKEPYRRRSQAAKEAREREHNAYMRSLTPEDIKRENMFRTAQRKAGKSRRGNLKDPNAPKKPLSAYFMFLQRIRSDPELVEEVFGEETETTKQSVLAASKWRSMTDEERKPFLAQAEQEKLDYEAKRKMYEEGTTGYGGSFNFSILPGSPIDVASIPRAFKPSASVKTEPEPEPDSPATEGDFGAARTIRSR